MFIQTETTPNPNTVKFLPGCEVVRPMPVDLPNREAAEEKSPLAARLFRVDGVERVFLGADFVSVTKAEDFDWNLIKPQILTSLLEHFSNGFPVLTEELEKQELRAGGNEITEDDDELTIQIKELLETRVRPAVAQDGGDIVFHKFEEGIVFLEMRGACAGCPSSTMTLKSGIENMLKHYVPEVLEVRAVEEG